VTRALDAVFPRLVVATTRFADVLRDADGNTPSAGTTWTIAEVGAHVLAITRVYLRSVQDGAPGWATLDGPTENARFLAQTPEREPKVIADAIEQNIAELEPRWRSVPSGTQIAWHGPITVEPAVVAGMALGEMLVHGLDIARARSRPWPIDAPDAAIVVDSALRVVEHFVDETAAAGFRATYGLSVRGEGAYTLTFEDGRLTASEGRPPRADCRISAAPVPFLLTTYNRQSPVRAALSGGVVAYGRKPWLAFTFPKLLRNP
jgi:uncharacterized protein (TIGR03083 family)